MKPQEVRQWALTGAVLIGGYLIFSKLSEKFGLTPSKEEKAEKKSKKEAENEQAKAKETVKDIKYNRTYTNGQISGMVGDLTNSAEGWFWDKPTVVLTFLKTLSFTYADARTFLSDFVSQKGETLNGWFNHKFINPTISEAISSGRVFTVEWVKKNLKHFKIIGVTPTTKFTDNEITKRFIERVYQIAKIDRV